MATTTNSAAIPQRVKYNLKVVTGEKNHSKI